MRDRPTYEELELQLDQCNKQLSKQKKVDYKLEKERLRMDLILSKLNTGLAIVNRDFTIEWVNAQIEKLLPWAEFVGKVCYEVAEQRNEPCEGCGAIMAFSDGQMHETFRQSPIDGKWLHIVSIPIMDDSGTIVKVLESTTDITKIKQTEQNLKQALNDLEKLKNQLEEENIFLKEEIATVQGFDEIVGKSNPFLYVLSKINQVAKTDTTVLIQGETGVGKDLIASAIHKASLRSDKPFVKLNCPSMPSHIIESELFGHEPGAFTSATGRRRGRFEMAEGGTIFLDEIGEIPFELQAKLLGVLQDRKFERVGGSKTIPVNVRVIAATNRKLKDQITTGQFRADLYYRLNVFPITVPPLRNRRDDIPSLVDYFVGIFTRNTGKIINQIPKTVLERLAEYEWPGNIRELKNILERACITSTGPTLCLPESISLKNSKSIKAVDSPGEFLSLQEMERRHILKGLEKTDWRINGDEGAAKLLNINPSTLRGRIKKLGLKR